MKDIVKLICRIIAFPFLVCFIALLVLVFGDPTPEEDDW